MSFDSAEAVRVKAEKEAEYIRPAQPHRSSIMASQSVEGKAILKS
jgi:hypothetical protein